MSTSLFNLYTDGKLKEVNVRVMDTGVRLQHNGHEWKTKKPLYADNTVLTLDSVNNLQTGQCV